MRTRPAFKAFLFLPAIVCLVLLFAGGPSYYSPRSLLHLWDLGHIFAFGLWTYITLLFIPKITKLSSTKISIFILIAAALLGALTEFAQHFVDGRTPSYSDLGRDIFGSSLVLVFSYPSSLRCLFVIALLWQLWTPGKAFIDERIATAQFPIIANFETPFELSRWEWHHGNIADISPIDSFSSRHSLKVTLSPRRYSGLSLKYFPGNWQGYNLIEFDINNTQQEDILLTCRIHDQQHKANGQQYQDRFNRILKITPGWQHIAIKLSEVASAPKGRRMDLSAIAGMSIFASNNHEDLVIYLDNIHLSQRIEPSHETNDMQL